MARAKCCRPRFMVKPRPKKAIAAGKSLRLKTALCAQPPAVVHWDRDGVILEGGNKFSVYHDQDFRKPP